MTPAIVSFHSPEPSCGDETLSEWQAAILGAQRTYRRGFLPFSGTMAAQGIFREAQLLTSEKTGIQGRNCVGRGRSRRMPDLARIVAESRMSSSPLIFPGARAAIEATSTIPIVAAVVADPIFLGIVQKSRDPERKRHWRRQSCCRLHVEANSLKEVVPKVRRVALIAHPDEPIPNCKSRMPRKRGALQIEPKTIFVRTLEDLRNGIQSGPGMASPGGSGWRARAPPLSRHGARTATEAGLPR